MICAGQGYSVNIEFGDVRQSAFSIQEDKTVVDEEILLNFSGRTGFSVENNLLKFRFKVWYFQPSHELDELVALETDNIFKIEDLQHYIDGTNINLPGQIWTVIVALSISHARVLLLQAVARTRFQSIMIPIIDPQNIAKQLFPEKQDSLKEGL